MADTPLPDGTVTDMPEPTIMPARPGRYASPEHIHEFVHISGPDSRMGHLTDWFYCKWCLAIHIILTDGVTLDDVIPDQTDA